MTAATTATERSVPREVERTEILDRFRHEHPELAEAMQLAGEAEAVWRAFEESREPPVTYTTSSGTTALR